MVKFSQIRGIPNYRAGLGWSPASGPKVGGPIYPSGIYYQYDKLSDLLPAEPIRYSFGSIPGNDYINLRTFPQLGAFPGEVGPGNTPGGIGGVNGPILYGVNTLEARQMAYGKKRRRRSRKYKSKSRRTKNRKSNKKRKSMRKRKR